MPSQNGNEDAVAPEAPDDDSQEVRANLTPPIMAMTATGDVRLMAPPAMSTTPTRSTPTTTMASPPRTILDEAEDCLAQSLLIFLYADLRLLSATGRISTKYENLCIASDEARKVSAAHMAGLSSDFAGTGEGTGKGEGANRKGISPAQIMAVLILELRKEVQAQRRGTKEETEEETSILSTLFDKRGRKKIEDDMHASLRCYNTMVGEDLLTEIPEFTATEQATYKSPKELYELMMQNIRERSQHNLAVAGTGSAESGDLVLNAVASDELSPGSESSLNLTARQRRVQSFNEEMQRHRERMNRHREVMFEGDEAIARHEFADVGDALVRMAKEGDTGGRNLSEDELLALMEEAVESRESGKLDFMSDFFKVGSVSQVMIKSKARVVWLNDWYPLKDCTYGISVDRERKRVLVVFRGAITRADWGHAGKLDLKKVANPVREEFEGKKKRINVHRGFYRYLFRERKDTGTKKYDEIARLLHEYGSKLGGQYSIVITGYSLGGALSTLFGFYASNDDRFTRNGPIQLFTFGSPYTGGTAFYDSFRHQESTRKLQHARFSNKRDGVASLPVSVTGEYQHVGVSVRLPRLRPRLLRFVVPEPVPIIRYPKDKNRCGFYLRALSENYFFNMSLPWNIRQTHGLNEHQKRMLRARFLCADGRQYPLHNKSLNEIYEDLLLN